MPTSLFAVANPALTTTDAELNSAIEEANNVHGPYADTDAMIASAVSTVGDVVKVGPDADNDFVLYKLNPSGDPSVLTDYVVIGQKSPSGTGDVSGKADQTALDAEIARATASESSKEPLLPAGADQYLKRNTSGAWELVDLPITPQNLIAGVGAPASGAGEDGFYYQQLDAAKGDNDIWGPKAGGAWPAQADFKSADPEEGKLSDFSDSVEGVKPKSWAGNAINERISLHFDGSNGVFDADTMATAGNPASIISFTMATTAANMPESHTTGMSGIITVSGNANTAFALCFI